MTPRRHALMWGLLIAAFLFAPFPVRAAQRIFTTPAAAAHALNEAVRSGDREAIARVLGPGSADMVDSGDDADDRVGRNEVATTASSGRRRGRIR